MKPFEEQTYYELLEVPPSANSRQIRDAYQRAQETYAPESVALYALEDPEVAQALRERLRQAFETLSDRSRRSVYDRGLGLPPLAPQVEDEEVSHPPLPPLRDNVVPLPQPVIVLNGANRLPASDVEPGPQQLALAELLPPPMPTAHSTQPGFSVSYIPRPPRPFAQPAPSFMSVPEPVQAKGGAAQDPPPPAPPVPELAPEPAEEDPTFSLAPPVSARDAAAAPEALSMTEPASVEPVAVSPVQAAPELAPSPEPTPAAEPAAPPEPAQATAAPEPAETPEPAEAAEAPEPALAAVVPLHSVPAPEADPDGQAADSATEETPTPAPEGDPEHEDAFAVAKASAEPAKDDDEDASDDPETPRPLLQRIPRRDTLPDGMPAVTLPGEPAKRIFATPEEVKAKEVLKQEVPFNAEVGPVMVTLRGQGSKRPKGEGAPELAQEPSVPIGEATLAQLAVRARDGRARSVEIKTDTEFNGELLRQIRESRGCSIQLLADRTRITLRHLENIEADRYGELPTTVYLRGFLTSIAREFGLDPVRVAKSYLALVAKHRG